MKTTKGLLLTSFLALLVHIVSAAEYRHLSDAEEASLRIAASKEAGIAVWLIQGMVLQPALDSQVKVVFEPADVANYCLAPFAWFRAKNSQTDMLEWNLVDGGHIQYNFWFQTCDVVEPEKAIVLEQYVDTSILDRLKRDQDELIHSAKQSLSPDHQYVVPISDHRLRRVGVRFDPAHGAVYKLDYSSMTCRGLRIDALLLPDETRILEAAAWVC